jgi:ABC-type phosphate transport system substrate-binding protein
MADIFIAYRRDDSADISGRIYDRLVAIYGPHSIFKDVISIQGGQRFPAQLENGINEKTIMLVIIGQRWLSLLQERQDDPYDFGRIELEIALRHHATIIPILVQGASMPVKSELPLSVADLANYQSLSVRSDPDFSTDLELIRRTIGPQVRPIQETRFWPVAISILLVVAIGMGFIWQAASQKQKNSPAATSTPLAALHCTDKQGNYPDGFHATGSQHAYPLTRTEGISGQEVNVTGSSTTESAIANARITFDPQNGTCTTIDSSRPGSVHGYFNFLSDTKNSYQIEASDFSITEVTNLPYNSQAVDAYQLGVIPSMVIVNQHIYNFIKNISRQTLQDIYTGKITSWRQVSGAAPDEPIQTIWSGSAQTLHSGWPNSSDLDSLYTISGPLVSFKRDVLGNQNTAAQPSQMITTGQLDILKAVLNPDAIGFVTYPTLDFYNVADPTYHFKDNIHFLTIDGYSPAIETDVVSNKYPFWNIAYVYIKKTVNGTLQGKMIAALLQDITSNPTFATIDFPELEWLPLADFSSVVLGCHETKDPCN